MEKLLSDIDLSRSAPMAIFLELEAAARSCRCFTLYATVTSLSFSDSLLDKNRFPSLFFAAFYDANQSSEVSSAVEAALLQAKSDVSLCADSSMTSEHGYETPYESSHLGTPRHDNYGTTDLHMEKSPSEQDLIYPMESTAKFGMFNKNHTTKGLQKFAGGKLPAELDASSRPSNRLSGDNDDTKPLQLDGTVFFPELKDCKQGVQVQRLSRESVESDFDSVAASEIPNLSVVNSYANSDLSGDSEAPKSADALTDSKLQTSKDLLVAFPYDDRHKMNRVLSTLKQRLDTGKTDVEDLMARINQEVAVRQFLSTKVFIIIDYSRGIGF